MKSRALIILTVMFLVLSLALVGCNGITPTGALSADIMITDWEQNYYEALGYWSDLVKVWYKVTNTGTSEIDYYRVWFTAYCIDGSSYEDWTNGLFVEVGHYEFDYTYINLGKNKQVVSVEITDWELENWGW